MSGSRCRWNSIPCFVCYFATGEASSKSHDQGRADGLRAARCPEEVAKCLSEEQGRSEVAASRTAELSDRHVYYYSLR